MNLLHSFALILLKEPLTQQGRFTKTCRRGDEGQLALVKALAEAGNQPGTPNPAGPQSRRVQLGGQEQAGGGCSIGKVQRQGSFKHGKQQKLVGSKTGYPGQEG